MSDGPAIPAYGARRAMPVESMLEQASGIPLEALMGRVDGLSDFATEVSRDREQVAALAATLLAPRYRPLLEWLCDITLRRPVFLLGLGPEAIAYGAHREGQNSIVWQLLRAAAEGRSETIEPREGV